MKYAMVMLVIVMLTAVSCGKPTATPTPADTPTASPTSLPTVALEQAATLYSGPGNLNYEILAELAPGTTLTLLGSYGDFVQVQTLVEGESLTGFVRGSLIASLPAGLPELTSSEVPWVNDFMASCAPDGYEAATDTAIITAGPGEVMFTPESLAFPLQAPVRIRIEKADVDTGYVNINLFGHLMGEESETDFFQGGTEMVVSAWGEGTHYSIAFNDGLGEGLYGNIASDISSSQPMEILFDDLAGTGFTILDGAGQVVKHVDLTTLAGVSFPDGLFPHGQYYFGFLIPTGTTARISGLEIGTEPAGEWVESVDPGPGLTELALDENLTIGTFFEIKKAIDRRYCQTLLRDFTQIEPMVDTQFWFGEGEYDFAPQDRYVKFAQDHDLELFGAIGCGDPEFIPDWLENGTYTREEYIDILKNLVTSFITRYKDSIHIWELANEAGDRDFYYPQPYSPTNAQSSNWGLRDFWYEKIGPEYIAMKFQWAHEANPDATLLFNSAHWGNPVTDEDKRHEAFIYNMVKGLVEADVPVDAVGFQLHYPAETTQLLPSKEHISEYLQPFADLGLSIHYTEMEVDVGSWGGTLEKRYALQAQVYREALDACLETGMCKSFTTWGFTDALSYITCPQSWLNCFDEPEGDPLLYDRNFNPKPAYLALQDALSGVPAPVYPEPTAMPSTEFIMENCVTSSSNPYPAPESTEALYDDFSNPAFDGRFDTSRWKLISTAASPIAEQSGGVFVIGNNHYEPSKDTELEARVFGEFTLDQPLAVQADIAICPQSTRGEISISMTSINLPGGLWGSSCKIEPYSSYVKLNCGDMLFGSSGSYTYATPIQLVDPGVFHRVRFEADPATMTFTYYIDGVNVGSHVLENPEVLSGVKFHIELATWKEGISIPLMGLFDNVIIEK